jgi:hypothetical protein
MPVPLRAGISEVQQARPAAPMSWMPTTAPVRITSRHASSRSFSVNGSPTWTVGRRASACSSNVGGRHRRAVDTVAARLVADVEHRVARPFGPGAEDLIGADQADAHHVDERIARVFRREGDLAAHRRAAEAVAVPADARDDAVHELLHPGLVELAEAERVEDRDRARAHREDVAQNAADTRRRALERLDERRMIVALDLEDDRPAVADIDRARVLARALQDVRAGLRQAREEDARVLVGAVLRPERREETELGVGRLAPEA